jgi:hypothetical protein
MMLLFPPASRPVLMRKASGCRELAPEMTTST